METIHIFIMIVALIGFGSIYLLEKRYLRNYLDQKGKNLADKEDIQSITKIVEEIRSGFTKEIEFIKANLNVLSNIQLSLIDEERKAIVDFNKSYFEWYDSVFRSSQMVSSFNDDEINEYKNKTAILYSTLLNSAAIYDLFVTDDNLRVLRYKLIIQSLKGVPILANNLLISIQKSNLEISTLKKISTGDALVKGHKELLEERKIIYDKYNTETLDIHKQLAPMQSEFQHNCREYLHKMLHDQKYKKETM